MPRQRGLSQSDIAERWRRILELSARGVPVAEIAKTVGVSETHVYRVRAKHRGSRSPRRNFTDREIATVEAMLSDGASISEAARTIGRHPASVNRRFRGRGWSADESAAFSAMMFDVRRSGLL